MKHIYILILLLFSAPYAAGREHVSDVWVAGQHLLKERVLTTLDQQTIVSKARQWGEKIQQPDEHPGD